MDKKVFNIRFNTLTDISIIKDQLVIEGFCDQQNLNFEKQIFLISTKDKRIILHCSVGNEQFICGKFFPLSDRYRHSYARLGKWILSKEGDDLVLTPASNLKQAMMEVRLWLEYLKLHGTIEIRGIKVRLFYFLFYHWQKKLQKKPILILSDRMDKAGDNAEALFRYIQNHHKDQVDCYFAVNPSSKSGKYLSKVGPIIAPGGKEYKKLYWKGAIMISSQAEDWIFRPYKGGTEAYKDLAADTHFIFLQHGITKDDLSGWLNRANKNIRILVTATKPELDSFIHGNYGYTSKQVKLTGFPRYDRLSSKPEKKITILLTWRNYLVELPDEKGKRALKENFDSSTYQQMLSNLISDMNFVSLVENYGYQLQIMLHPCMEELREILNKDADSRVHILPYDTSYSKIFSQSNLIITDYSSVAFDFANLRKPVIYYQQDQEEFFGGTHMYKQGYYDYEENGFGEVIYDKSQLFTVTESYLSNNCKLKEQYRERIDSTFPYSDRKNCERVYKEISKLYTKDK